MERNASSFVIRVTNGTGSVRQFASKAARCEARAAFELSDQPPRFGGAGLRSEMFLLGSPEAVTAAKATRNAVIRSLPAFPLSLRPRLGGAFLIAVLKFRAARRPRDENLAWRQPLP